MNIPDFIITTQKRRRNAVTGQPPLRVQPLNPKQRVPTTDVDRFIRAPRRWSRGAFLRGRAVLGGAGAFGGGYCLARMSALTYRRRLRESWAHSRRPSGPTHR